MSETVSFPGLGLEFNMDRVAFTLFGRSIYWYGIIIAVAFLLGALYVMKRVKTFGLDSDRVMDVVLGGVLLGIVGARLYYVLFSWDTYKDNPVRIFDIRAGGIAIYGGVIGALVAAVIICKWRKVKLLPALDLAAAALFLGQAIGRWGNFINVEAFGSNTTAPWGMTSSSVVWYLQQHRADLAAIGVTVDPNLPVHPTFFYESMWCLLGFLFLCWYTSRRRFDGELSLIYIGWYGLGRFFIEGLRTDSLLLGSIRVSQIVALLCVIASALIMVSVRSKIRRSNDPGFMPLYVNTPEGQLVVAGEFYKKKEKAEEKTEAEESEDTEDEEAVAETEDEAVADIEAEAVDEVESDKEEKPEGSADGADH